MRKTIPQTLYQRYGLDMVGHQYVVNVGKWLPRLGSDTSCQQSRLRSPSKQSTGLF